MILMRIVLTPRLRVVCRKDRGLRKCGGATGTSILFLVHLSNPKNI